jgi:hypothetical protein
MVLRRLLLVMAPVLLGCSATSDAPPPAATTVTDVTLQGIDPGVIVPGTTMVLTGASFVPDFAGATTLRLVGTFDGAAASVGILARFVDYDRMEIDWPGAVGAGFPAGVGVFSGTASVETSSNLDGLRHLSPAIDVTLDVREYLTPRLDSLQNEVVFVNDPVVAHGEGFLLGGAEGQTFAIVEGCFTLEGQTTCAPVGPTEVAAKPFESFDRTRAVFPFSPYIAGINPGTFTGSIRMVNRHANSAELGTDSIDTDNSIIEPVVIAVSPGEASLGQYVDITGGGFVGAAPGEDPTFSVTTIELSGTFTPEGGPTTPASITLVPEFVDGQLVRYVLNEEDELGQAVDLRKIAGSFEGTVRPIVQFGNDTVIGPTTPAILGIGYVKQVVWLNFLPQYVESLRHFGVRGVDTLVRERVVEVVRRDFAGVNLEVRVDEPQDFALFSEVEIGGPDPNQIGLLGYDNTPGKDDGNLRLYDKIGGVNALTQLDGYPGYGGVFVESLFIFSEHPAGFADDVGAGHPRFDDIFDPFRPDVGGKLIALSEVANVPVLSSTIECPAADRPTRIACAIVVIGNLVGTTVSHEIAHSLGLADPGGDAFHNTGDWPAAIMDGGAARSFLERAELDGMGPGVFCQPNYDYLRLVLPTGEPDPLQVREDCY